MHHIQAPLSITSDNLSDYWEAFLEALNERWHIAINPINIRKECVRLEKNHDWRKRKSGDDYHSHLYEVAYNYIEYAWKYLTKEWLKAALRHDDFEDLPDMSLNQIEEGSWETVRIMVEMLSKNSQLWITEYEETYLNNFNSLSNLEKVVQMILTEYNKNIPQEQITLIARTVAIIKICDRIHNLRTMPLDTYPQDKRRQKIEEADNYFVTLAQSLWLPELRDKLIKAIIYATRDDNKIRFWDALRRDTLPKAA